MKSLWLSEKPRRLIRYDWLWLQLPGGHGDRHLLRLMFIDYFTFI